jgi:hypothetical protein
MDSTVIAAIISGVFAIITPLIILFLKKRNTEVEASSNRSLSVIGQWHGDILTDIDDYEIKEPVVVNIFDYKKGLLFKANIKVKFPDTEDYSFDLEGSGELSHG